MIEQSCVIYLILKNEVSYCTTVEVPTGEGQLKRQHVTSIQ